jgi:hypothetical protein
MTQQEDKNPLTMDWGTIVMIVMFFVGIFMLLFSFVRNRAPGMIVEAFAVITIIGMELSFAVGIYRGIEHNDKTQMAAMLPYVGYWFLAYLGVLVTAIIISITNWTKERKANAAQQKQEAWENYCETYGYPPQVPQAPPVNPYGMPVPVTAGAYTYNPQAAILAKRDALATKLRAYKEQREIERHNRETIEILREAGTGEQGAQNSEIDWEKLSGSKVRNQSQTIRKSIRNRLDQIRKQRGQ